MSANMAPKQRTPSVIAKLMGLDELPSQQPVQKQQRVLSENYLRKVASIGVREKHSIHERCLFRSSIEEQVDFMDLCEVSETFERGKLRTKSISEDIKLQSLNEYHRSLRDSDSTKEYLQKYGGESDSLLINRLHDLPTVPQPSKSRSTTVVKPSCASDRRNTVIRGNFGWEAERENVNSMKKPENDLVADFLGEPGLDVMHKIPKPIHHKFSRSQLETENKTSSLYTRIVILKPTLGKTKNLAHDVEPVRHRSRVGGTANGRTAIMSCGINCDSKELSVSRYPNAGTIAEFSKLTTPSPSFSGWNNRYESSSCHLDRSYLAREARKKISERWKLRNKNQEVGLPNSRGTLGELLALLDHESRPPESLKLQFKTRKQNLNQKDASEFRKPGLGCMKSQSYPRSELDIGHTTQENNVFQDELKHKLEEEGVPGRNSMALKLSSCCVSVSKLEKYHAVCKILAPQDGQRDKLRDSSVLPESPIGGIATFEVSRVSDVTVGVEYENSEQPHVEPTDIILFNDDNSFPRASGTSFQQDTSTGLSEAGSVSSYCSVTDSESLTNLDEAYQPSPISVLDPLCKEEISTSSECCQKINPNLHGLQRRLELLKSELSESYSEEPGMILSSDEDSEEGSGGNEDLLGLFIVEESRDFSYLVDVLNETGFPCKIVGMCFDKCPLSSSVFEMLEKRYGEQTSWKRSERKLLFDRINLGLMDILNPQVGVPTWANPVTRRLSFRQTQESIAEELWRVLVSEGKVASNYSSEKVLAKDDGWLDLSEDIEEIGKEVESWLMDELIVEVIKM